MSEEMKNLENSKIGDGDLEKVSGGDSGYYGGTSNWYTIYCTSGVVALRDRNNINVQIAALNRGDRVQDLGRNGEFAFVYAERVQMYGYVNAKYLR